MRSFALAVLVTTACHASSNAPACDSVAGQFYILARRDLANATVDPATQRAVSDQLPAMRDSLKDACKDGAWSADVRTCLVKAADHVAMQACEQALSDDQRAALDRAARGEATPR